MEPKKFGRNTQEFLLVKEWVANNRGGWDRYRDTTPVGNYYISGVGLSLNIGSDWVILLDKNSKGEHRKLSKKVPLEEFSFLDGFNHNKFEK